MPVNRDVQMKYDVAKNEGGPLRRTVKPEQPDEDTRDEPELEKGKGKARVIGDDTKPTLQRHPGLGERFTNLEDHLAVRYGAHRVFLGHCVDRDLSSYSAITSSLTPSIFVRPCTVS